MPDQKSEHQANQKPITIGALAKLAGVSTSLLRYYEDEGLLKADGRTDSGYRLYSPVARQRLMFIQRAQRLGFSLADIRTMLNAKDRAENQGVSLTAVAGDRLLDIEKRFTELLVLRHELELFMRELQHSHQQDCHAADRDFYGTLIEHFSDHHHHHAQQGTIVDTTLTRLGCRLADVEKTALLKALRGRHVHVWRENDAYLIQIPDADEKLEKVLSQSLAAEDDCAVHVTPHLERSDNGLLLRADGPHAFLYAQFFLALETEASR
jgi:MerR family copper efflux transcriptional regulator